MNLMTQNSSTMRMHLVNILGPDLLLMSRDQCPEKLKITLLLQRLFGLYDNLPKMSMPCEHLLCPVNTCTGDFADEIKLRTLKWERFFWIIWIGPT